MKIALLTDGIHPYVIGGMQKHSFFLARELARARHTVYLFHCNESSYDASKLEFFSKEEREYIKSYLIPFPHKYYFPFHYIYESHKYSEAIYKALEPILKDLDFILAQGFCAWALLDKKPTAKRPPVAVLFHGLEMFQYIPSFKEKIAARFLKNAVKANLSKADYTLSFGGKLTNILTPLIDRSKIWEIPGGIEKSWLSASPAPLADKVRFVFVGRYERRKGIPELNEAIKKLLPRYNFSFDFIGDIPNEHRILHASIKYYGKLSSEEEIKQILAKNDVLVCPSYAEGMPTVILEAMACGLAIIATNVGAVSRLVDNSNGWLMRSPAMKNIIEAINSAAGDKELLQKKAASLEKIKNNFLVGDVTNQIIKKIEACL